MRTHLRNSILLAALLILWALPAAGAGKVVGVVLTGDLPRYRDAHRAFVKALDKQGYGQWSVDLVVQSPNTDPVSWVNAVRKLTAIGARVIVAYGAPAAAAAVREAGSTPVVFVDVYDPQLTGVLKEMGGDGGTVTGVSSKVPLVTLVKTALELKPFKHLGVLYNPREIGSVVQLQELKRLAGKYGFSVAAASAASPASLDAALTSLLSQVDSLYVAESVQAGKQFEKILAKAAASRVPVFSLMPGASERGALLALEVSPSDQGELAAEAAAKILAGTRGGRLPVRIPRQIELVINLKTAQALDIQVPFQVLSVVTKVVK